MRRFVVACGFCSAQLTPFVVKKSGKHKGQYCVNCFCDHPEHGGNPYWFFWDLGVAPPGYPIIASPKLPEVADEPTARTLVELPEDFCEYPGCKKRKPAKGPKCARKMCKYHCIISGGCESAMQHREGFLTQKQRQRNKLLPVTISIDNQSPPQTPPNPDHLSLEDDDEAVFARDMAIATAQSLSSTDSHNIAIDPRLQATTYTSGSKYPASIVASSSSDSSAHVHASSSSSTTSASRQVIPSMSSTQSLTQKTQREPKRTVQMSAAWQGIYKYDHVDPSEKAQKEKDRIAGDITSKRTLDVYWWDVDSEPPKIIALQGTGRSDSDIPHWPRWTLLDNPGFLALLGSNIIYVQMFDFSARLWKSITKLSYEFHIRRNGDHLLLRREGVIHCSEFDGITARLDVSFKAPHLFRNIKQERQSIRNSLASLKATRPDIDFTTPSPMSRTSAKRQREEDPSDDEDDLPSHKRQRYVKDIGGGRLVTHSGFAYIRPMYDDSPVRAAIAAGQPIPHIYPWQGPTATDEPIPSSATTLYQCPRSPSSAASSSSSLPSLLGSIVRTQSTDSDISSLRSPSPMQVSPCVTPSGTHPRRLAWPNGSYVVDVVAGLDKMVNDPNLIKLTVQQRFETAFPGVTYVKESVRDAKNRWKQATDDFRTQLCAAGRTPGGLWDVLRKATPLKKQKGYLINVDIDLTGHT